MRYTNPRLYFTLLDNSYLQFKFQLPTSDSTQITAGGPKVPIEGFVHVYLTQVL